MRFGAKLLLVGALLMVLGSGFHLYYATDVAYPYRVGVGSHLANALSVQTPEELIREVGLAEEGMRNLGLEDHMSRAYFWWDKLPSNNMAFQYEYLNQIRERAESVIAWRESALGNNTEQFQDVYEAKMGSLKAMIHRGCGGKPDPVCADWIAEPAYLLAYHKIYYVGVGLTIPLFFGGMAWGTFGVTIALDEKGKRWRDMFYDKEESLNAALLAWGLVATPFMIVPMAIALAMAAFA